MYVQQLWKKLLRRFSAILRRRLVKIIENIDQQINPVQYYRQLWPYRFLWFKHGATTQIKPIKSSIPLQTPCAALPSSFRLVCQAKSNMMWQ
jgi:hypothetical protein